MKGLYVLLPETNTIMNKIILEDLEETTSLFMKIEANGTLGSVLVSTFGQWYVFPPVSTFSLLKLFFLNVCLFLFNDFLLIPVVLVDWWWD
jgi:hypothetical protein